VIKGEGEKDLDDKSKVGKNKKVKDKKEKKAEADDNSKTSHGRVSPDKKSNNAASREIENEMHRNKDQLVLNSSRRGNPEIAQTEM